MRGLFLILVALAATAPAAAGPREDGFAALLRKDFAAAVSLWRPLAVEGDATLQYLLGEIHDTGRGVPQNYGEAARWYRLAAEQGHALAQNNLGVMYLRGQGVPQDYVLAHMWFNLAAARWNDPAVENRDLAAGLMTREQVAEAQRLAADWRPKALVHPAYPLALGNIAPAQDRDGETLVLVVTGDISNIAEGTQVVPRLRGAILDAQSREIYTWTFDPPSLELRAGETVAFATRVPNPPEGARGVAVTFAEPEG